MDNEKRLQTVLEADETADLLAHVGWTDVLKPALQRKREIYAGILVAAVLGRASGPQDLSKEQYAGLVFGIDETIKLIEDVLKRGSKALKDLESQGFHLTSTNL